MSILMVLEAMPNRVRALAEVVTSEKTLSREELARRFVPGATKREQFDNLLRETIHLGLLTEDSSAGVIRLADGLSRKDVTNPDQFLQFSRNKLFITSAESDGVNRAFPRALAWFLSRPIGPQLKKGAEFQSYLRSDLKGDEIYELTNASRSDMLIYWAQALGFAEWLILKKDEYCNPDPTRAIAAVLSNTLKKGVAIPISDAVRKIGRQLPVLETGKFRTEVEVRLNAPREELKLSQSTTLALTRLEKAKVLSLDSLSDASSFALPLFDGKDRSVSHLTLI